MENNVSSSNKEAIRDADKKLVWVRQKLNSP